MLDKRKIIDFLQNEIESCKMVGDTSDKAIIWECKRILKRIELGLFDSEDHPVGSSFGVFEKKYYGIGGVKVF